MSRRWFVIDTRAWEVVAPTEAEAIASVLGDPDRAPDVHTTEAEPVVRSAAPDEPMLGVLS